MRFEQALALDVAADAARLFQEAVELRARNADQAAERVRAKPWGAQMFAHRLAQSLHPSQIDRAARFRQPSR